jgi:hypothetical protein
MDIAQLMGRYHRLHQELSAAHGQQPWHSALIDRLAQELAATARQIADRQPVDEQCDDSLLCFSSASWRPLQGQAT